MNDVGFIVDCPFQVLGSVVDVEVAIELIVDDTIGIDLLESLTESLELLRFARLLDGICVDGEVFLELSVCHGDILKES